MARLPALTFDELTPEQKELWQEIGAVRNGSPGGPFQVWMNHPKVAERAHYFGNALRVEGKVEWDPAKMRITNNADANKYVRPYIRKSWEKYLPAKLA